MLVWRCLAAVGVVVSCRGHGLQVMGRRGEEGEEGRGRKEKGEGREGKRGPGRSPGEIFDFTRFPGLVRGSRWCFGTPLTEISLLVKFHQDPSQAGDARPPASENCIF